MLRRLAFNSIAAVKDGRDPHGVLRDGGGDGGSNDGGGNDAGSNDVIRFDARKNFSDHEKSPVAAS